jgi:hypothetical protein
MQSLVEIGLSFLYYAYSLYAIPIDSSFVGMTSKGAVVHKQFISYR